MCPGLWTVSHFVPDGVTVLAVLGVKRVVLNSFNIESATRTLDAGRTIFGFVAQLFGQEPAPVAPTGTFVDSDEPRVGARHAGKLCCHGLPPFCKEK